MPFFETIYVQLMNEGTIVYRPVAAQKIDEAIYEILQDDMVVLGEEWEFHNGSNVIVENRLLSGGNVLVAISNFKHT